MSCLPLDLQQLEPTCIRKSWVCLGRPWHERTEAGHEEVGRDGMIPSELLAHELGNEIVEVSASRHQCVTCRFECECQDAS